QRVADAIAAYEANQNNGNGTQNKASGSVGGVEHTTRRCSYKEFLNFQPRNFDRTKGSVGLTRWFEKMESVFHICNCVKSCQVKAEDDVDGGRLSEKQRVGTTLSRYVTLEYKKVERYIWGLTKNIQGKVNSSKPTKIQEAIRLAHDLMDQVGRAKAAKDADNKRKWEDDQEGNHCQHQNKRHEVVKVYVTGTCNKTGYAGTLQLYDKCNLHHNQGPCPAQCGNCWKVGHYARDCWTPTSVTCYECGDKGHTRKYWPNLEDQNEAEKTCHDPNIITGTSSSKIVTFLS
ncbi:reverse transcriptase domain-containing protein, partial [Tanacetum coccineum]